MTQPAAIERIATGVPGLDTVLRGGLLKGGVYIVEGPPGSGKTILGNQMCFHRAAAGESVVYLTLLAEAHTRMIAHLRGMDFFRPELIASSNIYYISAFKVLEKEGLDGLLQSLRDAQHKRNATFIVLDGLVSAEEFAPTARDFKKFIHELQTISSMTGATVVMLSSSERAETYCAEHTMVDGIIELSEIVVGVRLVRGLVVRKMRGTAQLRGRHSVDITSSGVTVRPRIEALLPPADEADPAPATREPAGFGVAGLDAMVGGGLPGNSTTVLLGPPGSGKTLLGLQFLVAGCRQGERGLYFGFFERPAGILTKGQRLGFDCARLREERLLHLCWEAPIEGVLDEVVERILREVMTHKIQRVCFDGLHGFRHHAEYPERTRAVFAALADALTRVGVTTIFTLETTDLVGPRIEVPVDGVSSLADNLILLRHVEMRAELRRLVSIVKIRDSSYDAHIREFKITDNGLSVADTFDSAEQILTGAARVVPDPTP